MCFALAYNDTKCPCDHPANNNNNEEMVQKIDERKIYSRLLKNKEYLVYLIANTVFSSVVFMPPVFMVSYSLLTKVCLFCFVPFPSLSSFPPSVSFRPYSILFPFYPRSISFRSILFPSVLFLFRSLPLPHVPIHSIPVPSPFVPSRSPVTGLPFRSLPFPSFPLPHVPFPSVPVPVPSVPSRSPRSVHFRPCSVSFHSLTSPAIPFRSLPHSVSFRPLSLPSPTVSFCSLSFILLSYRHLYNSTYRFNLPPTLVTTFLYPNG